MGRSPCCEKQHTNKGAWTKQEDDRLINYINAHGEGCWRSLPKAAGLLRCGKSCRLRWINYLRSDLKRGNFTQDEDQLIIHLHTLLGNKWSLIAARLPGRTDNEIKNYWNTHIKRRLYSRGIDPKTHQPLRGAAPAAASTTTTVINPPNNNTAAPEAVITATKKITNNGDTNSMSSFQLFGVTCVTANTKVITACCTNKTDSSVGGGGGDEDSNSSSGMTTEQSEAYPTPKLNLDLSLGPPSHNHHVSSIINSKRQRLEHQQNQQEEIWYSQLCVGTCNSVGFQAGGGGGCSSCCCRAKGNTNGAVITHSSHNNVYRFYNNSMNN